MIPNDMILLTNNVYLSDDVDLCAYLCFYIRRRVRAQAKSSSIP
jgi:hypothetical protein